MWLPRGHGGPLESRRVGARGMAERVQAGKCLHPESACVLQSSWVHGAGEPHAHNVLWCPEAVTRPRCMGRLPASRTQAVGDIEYRGVVWPGGLDPKQAKSDIETPLAG